MTILKALKGMESQAQKRTLMAAATFLNISLTSDSDAHSQARPVSEISDSGISSGKSYFTENRNMSPKHFMREKLPLTEVERVACLAYYLTHYKDTPHFKTIDISTLNTEAAQPKFSNTAYAVENATKAQLLVPASKGSKQLSTIGELFVQKLPDRLAAKESISVMQRKKRNKKNNYKKPI